MPEIVSARGIGLSLLRDPRRLARSALHELGDVIDAGAEHDAIDEHEQEDGDEHARAGDRRYRVGRAQYARDARSMSRPLSPYPPLVSISSSLASMSDVRVVSGA
jgi:hypothetical protein